MPSLAVGLLPFLDLGDPYSVSGSLQASWVNRTPKCACLVAALLVDRMGDELRNNFGPDSVSSVCRRLSLSRISRRVGVALGPARGRHGEPMDPVY